MVDQFRNSERYRFTMMTKGWTEQLMQVVEDWVFKEAAIRQARRDQGLNEPGAMSWRQRMQIGFDEEKRLIYDCADGEMMDADV